MPEIDYDYSYTGQFIKIKNIYLWYIYLQRSKNCHYNNRTFVSLVFSQKKNPIFYYVLISVIC